MSEIEKYAARKNKEFMVQGIVYLVWFAGWIICSACYGHWILCMMWPVGLLQKIINFCGG